MGCLSSTSLSSNETSHPYKVMQHVLIVHEGASSLSSTSPNAPAPLRLVQDSNVWDKEFVRSCVAADVSARMQQRPERLWAIDLDVRPFVENATSFETDQATAEISFSIYSW